MSRLKQLQTMLDEEPKDSFLLFAIAKEHEKAGSIVQAITYYEKVVLNDSKYVGVYYHLGSAYAEQGDKDKAKDVLNKGIQICKEVGDQHALSELKSVLMNIDIE